MVTALVGVPFVAAPPVIRMRPSGTATDVTFDTGVWRACSGTHGPTACDPCASNAPDVTATRASNPNVMKRFAFNLSTTRSQPGRESAAGRELPREAGESRVPQLD